MAKPFSHFRGCSKNDRFRTSIGVTAQIIWHDSDGANGLLTNLLKLFSKRFEI